MVCQAMYLRLWLRGNSMLFYFKCGNFKVGVFFRSWMKLTEMLICTMWPATL